MNSASCRLIHVQALNACPPGPDGPRIRIQGWTLSAHATARPKIGSCPVCACWRENAATCCVRLKLLFPCLIAREADDTETVSERVQCRIGNEEHQIPKGLTWIARGFNPVLKRVDLKSATGKLNRSAGFFGRRKPVSAEWSVAQLSHFSDRTFFVLRYSLICSAFMSAMSTEIFSFIALNVLTASKVFSFLLSVFGFISNDVI